MDALTYQREYMNLFPTHEPHFHITVISSEINAPEVIVSTFAEAVKAYGDRLDLVHTLTGAEIDLRTVTPSGCVFINGDTVNVMPCHDPTCNMSEKEKKDEFPDSDPTSSG